MRVAADSGRARMGYGARPDTEVRSQRIPPHNLPAETALLGAMMLSLDAVADVEGLVDSSHFYRRAHGAVFDAIIAASKNGKADPIVVLDLLDKQHIDTLGGLQGLLDMEMNAPVTSNAPQYAESVRECAMRRNLIWVCGEMANEAYEGPLDSAALLDQTREQFLALDSSPGSIQPVPFYSSLDAMLTVLQDVDEGRQRGVPTGFHDLDHLLRGGGLTPGYFYVVGARPSMGKSALVAEWAFNVACSSGPVLLVSLEMPEVDISLRLMSSRGRIDASSMLNGGKSEKEWNQITSTISKLMDAPLFLWYRSGATAADVRRAARQVRAREGDLRLVVVDYLQLMGGADRRRPRDETRQLEIAEISRSLKVMAGEMGCPVLAVSQLNRAVEARHDKRPTLSDLRESGAIEQDADVVMLLYREEVYKPDDPKTQGLAELNVAKNRNGPTDRVTLNFLSRFTAFVPGKPARL
ncbi:MAG: replicative DNA helicase [Gemmatimonadetes bacterium]|nr:replicative DNA helicase [Gemmatimonadota bacterium]